MSYNKKLLFINSIGITGIDWGRNTDNDKIYEGSAVDLKNRFSIYLY